MQNKTKINRDIELIARAAVSGIALSEIDVEQSQENQKLWKMINASSDKLYKSGIDAQIPF